MLVFAVTGDAPAWATAAALAFVLSGLVGFESSLERRHPALIGAGN
jgi:hypothetical protein